MIDKKTYRLYTEPEKAILVGLITREQTEAKMNEYLVELEFLAFTAGAKTMCRFTQRFNKPEVSTFVGKGKVEEIKKYVEENQIDVVLFDDELSPAQQRNLEKALNVKVLDRT